MRWDNLEKPCTRPSVPLELAPLSSVTHLGLAELLSRQKDFEKAIKEARLSINLGQENPRAHFVLLTSLFYHGEDASDAAREALAVSPYNAKIHHLLGVALARKGDAIGAFNQLSYAVLTKPEWTEASADLHSQVLALVNSSAAAKLLHQAAFSVPDATGALDELAWVFATHPSDELRDGNEAVLLAERACALTKRTDAMLLATLAAAYAETGNFGEAINTIQESLSKARSTGNADAIALGERLLASSIQRPYSRRSKWKVKGCNPVCGGNRLQLFAGGCSAGRARRSLHTAPQIRAYWSHSYCGELVTLFGDFLLRRSKSLLERTTAPRVRCADRPSCQGPRFMPQIVARIGGLIPDCDYRGSLAGEMRADGITAMSSASVRKSSLRWSATLGDPAECKVS